MTPLYTTLSYLQIFISISLILLVVIQKTTGNGLFTTSQSNPFMSGAEITGFVIKLTSFFVALFFLNTLFLAKISYTLSKEKQNLVTSVQIKNENTSIPVTD